MQKSYYNSEQFQLALILFVRTEFLAKIILRLRKKHFHLFQAMVMKLVQILSFCSKSKHSHSTKIEINVLSTYRRASSWIHIFLFIPFTRFGKFDHFANLFTITIFLFTLVAYH